MVLNLDHPDLVLVEDLSSTESHMVSLQFKAFELKWASLGAHSSLNLFINALELYKLRTTSLLTEDAIAMIEAFDLTFELLLTDGTHSLSYLSAPLLFAPSDHTSHRLAIHTDNDHADGAHPLRDVAPRHEAAVARAGRLVCAAA